MIGATFILFILPALIVALSVVVYVTSGKEGKGGQDRGER